MTCFPDFFFLTESENDIYGFPFRKFLATNFDFVGFENINTRFMTVLDGKIPTD